MGIAPYALLPVALLVFGGTLLLSTAGEVDLGAFGGALGTRAGELTREASRGAAGMQLLVAIAAVVLGIVALLSASPMLFTLVGLLAVGASTLLSGAAVGG